MTREKIQSAVVLLFRAVLAGIFIYAGVIKIISPTAFAQDIDNYQVLPYMLVTLTAVVLPWLEVICGVLLIAGIWLRPASHLILLMSFVFIIAISSAIIRGLDISCGCFGGGSAAVGFPKLMENLGLAIMAGVVYWHSGKSPQN